MSERVRLYADRSFLPPGAPHTPLLEPFWGARHTKYDDERSALAGRYRRWRERGGDVYELVSLDEADVAVLPGGWEVYVHTPEHRELAHRYAERVRAAGRPLVAFYVADSTDPVPLASAHVFRTSIRRSRRGAREYPMAALAADVVEEDLGGQLPLREWRPRPVVGFCGYAPDAGLRGRVRSLARRVLRVPSHPAYVRTRACRALARSRRVDTNFVFRPAYWAGVIQPDGSLDYEAMRAARAEFVRNLVESDYVLTARGGGNFSYRLYEALSCGRIPVFIDTDSVLPFEDEIDWRSLCVWVRETELREIGDRVAAFNADLDRDGFLARQRECRRVFVERLSPDGFFRHLARTIRGLEP